MIASYILVYILELDTANYCKSKLPRFHWPVVFHVCPGNPGEQSFQQSAQGRANDALQRASNWLRNAKRGVFVSPNSSPSVQSMSPVQSRVQVLHLPLEHYSTVQWQDKTTSVRFKLAVRGDTGAGGLVVPLPCTAYFGKLAVLFGCSLPQQALA